MSKSKLTPIAEIKKQAANKRRSLRSLLQEAIDSGKYWSKD